MMDTDILFRDAQRFKSEFNNAPSAMTSDSAYSTTCEGSDSDTFSPWNFNSGMSMEDEFLLDKFEIPADALSGLEHAWANSSSMDTNLTSRVKQEPIYDTHYELACIKKDFPALEDIANIPLLEDQFNSEFPIADLPTELCSFINGEEVSSLFQPILENKPTIEPQIKAGRKKIDLQAQRYIVEDEEEENVDIETVSENGNNPVLEAGDLNSLLEQFEASEVEKPAIKEEKIVPIEPAPENNESSRKNKYKNDCKQNKKLVQGASVSDASKKVENASSTQQKYVKSKDICQNSNKSIGKTSAASSNRQIIDALPRELIDRIKESGKRKKVAIIDPVPNNVSKKRKIQEIVHSQPTVTATTSSNGSALRSIELDHSYSTVAQKSQKTTVKDSGYISEENDDKTINNQPIVKNVDGKLMISLLKTNTIKTVNEEKNRKKLNFEEYKKRRQGILSTPVSSSNSPFSSNCSSPLPEDDRTKRLKHEEKLRKMALELLNTPPKSSISNVKETPKDKVPVETVKTTPPPVDMDVITYVSMGVNTDVTGEDPFAPAKKLEEIKPLLEQASAKINSNSLINSLIENIPNVIKSDVTSKNEPTKKEHGEDKTIIYLPKNRRLPKTTDIAIQTSISLVGNNKRRYRHRRDSSSSSCSSDGSYRSCKRSRKSRYSGSRSSRSSSTDSSSSRSFSRSRSRSITRSPSPQKRRRRKRGYDKEYVREVEERRVVYVGKLAPKTTKDDLYRRFSKFGPIKTISIHFRNAGDNYGFVTFANKLDAYKAIEHGNDNPYDIHYDLSFGGRRLFCKTTYSDLDNMRDDFYSPRKSVSNDFDILLKELQEKMKKRKV